MPATRSRFAGFRPASRRASSNFRASSFSTSLSVRNSSRCAKSCVTHSNPSRSTTPTPPALNSGFRMFPRCGGDFISPSCTCSTVDPKATFSPLRSNESRRWQAAAEAPPPRKPVREYVLVRHAQRVFPRRLSQPLVHGQRLQSLLLSAPHSEAASVRSRHPPQTPAPSRSSPPLPPECPCGSAERRCAVATCASTTTQSRSPPLDLHRGNLSN